MATTNFFSQKRAWSIYKDKILDDYLVPYIAKISKTYKPITIVDCFAGKGKFDDGSDGSPIIIMNRIKYFKEKNNISNVRAIFIESKYYKELKNNLNDYYKYGIEYEIFEGTFESNIDKLFKINKDNNLFIYLDPYGIKSLKFDYFSKLVNKHFNSMEMLLNFNSIGFLREACRLMKFHNELITLDETDEAYEIDDDLNFSKMDIIANGNYWANIIDNFNNRIFSFDEAEEELVRNYTLELQKLFKYVIKIPIKSKVKNIPKYRIIFSTNHPDGIILMAENMNKTWDNILSAERRFQGVLFDEYELYYDESETPSGEIINILKINNNKIGFKELYLELIKKFGFKFIKKDYVKIINDLENQGVLKIIRTPKYNKKNKLNTSFDYKNNNIDIILLER